MSNAVSYVWVVTHNDPFEEIYELIGVFSSRQSAESAKREYIVDWYMDEEVTEADYPDTVTIEQVRLQ